jgi:hypothetical protein
MGQVLSIFADKPNAFHELLSDVPSKQLVPGFQDLINGVYSVPADTSIDQVMKVRIQEG